MKRFVCSLLAGAVVLGVQCTDTHTDKTFLMPRSHNENMAMEYTGFHKAFRKIDDNKWGSIVQATGFYQQSNNGGDLGKYFGKYNNSTGPLVPSNIYKPNIYAGKIQDFIWVTDRAPLATSPMNNNDALLLGAKRMIHDSGSLVTDHLDVAAIMRPKQTSFGVTFDWYQKLDKLAKGLYMKVSVPVVHVSNDMNMSYSKCDECDCIARPESERLTQNVPLRDSTDTVSLAEYLSGHYSLEGVQKPLCAAKITCDDHCTTEVADVDVTVGYNFLYTERKHFGVNLAMTIPTSSKPTGEFLFEPVTGLAGHWAFGMGLDCAFELWHHSKRSLDFVGALNYKYVLDATERRTLGMRFPNDLGVDVRGVDGKRIPMSRYFLGAQKGEQEVFPLANVLTTDVGVTPGSRIELLTMLTLRWGHLFVDAGYNLFAKEEESVMVKCWRDDQYALVSPTYVPVASGFTASDRYAAGANNSGQFWINKCDLIAHDAATPVAVTHKALLGVSYDWRHWEKYPILLGIGGSWEFVQNSNSALDGWAVWAKAGVSF